MTSSICPFEQQIWRRRCGQPIIRWSLQENVDHSLTSTFLSSYAASARGPQSAHTHTPSTRLSAAHPVQTHDLPFSIDSHSETTAAQRHWYSFYGDFFFVLVPFARREMQYVFTLSSTRLYRPLSVVRRKRDARRSAFTVRLFRSEEHTSELQSPC